MNNKNNNRPINQPTKQSTNQPVNQPTNQTNKQTRIFILSFCLFDQSCDAFIQSGRIQSNETTHIRAHIRTYTSNKSTHTHAGTRIHTYTRRYTYSRTVTNAQKTHKSGFGRYLCRGLCRRL